jgi:hypothetical protein
VEVEGVAAPEGFAGHYVKRAGVHVGFFDGLSEGILTGRNFAPSDLAPGRDRPSTSVIVNASFVERVLHGANPIGRRLRYLVQDASEEEPWYEIVGVVGDLGMIDSDGMSDGAGLYHPVPAGAYDPVKIVIQLGAQPLVFAPRLRAITAAIEPAAIIEDPQLLSEVGADDRFLLRWLFFGVGVVAGVSVLLSVASLYALMSFTVSRRTHEIGIRAALGADSTRITAVIARKAMFQLTVGILVAVTAIAVVVGREASDLMIGLEGWPFVLAGAAGAVLLVGLIACVAPTRRALRIRPMEAMRT